VLAERHDLVRIDVVADGQLTARDDAFGLVADVEQHLVLVDLDHGPLHDLAVLHVHEGLVDGISEGHAQVVDDDLAGVVRALLVEGASEAGIRRGERRVVGQGGQLSRRGDVRRRAARARTEEG
jgi:hypothetical protein